MFHPSENHTNQRRKKRKVRNFDYEPSRKWPLPIKYAIDKNAISMKLIFLNINIYLFIYNVTNFHLKLK